MAKGKGGGKRKRSATPAGSAEPVLEARMPKSMTDAMAKLVSSVQGGRKGRGGKKAKKS